MARKAKRSKKQIAAARKNLRKARNARKRNPLSASAAERIRKGSRKAKARGKKAARTRARNKAKHRAAGKKGARAKARKSPRRTHKRKSAKRVAAGRKAARTRAHRRAQKRDDVGWAGGDPSTYGERRRKRRKAKRRAKRKNPLPLQANARRRRKRRRNPLPLTAAAPRRRRKKGRASPRKYKRGKKAGYSTRGKGKRYTKRRRANAARRGHDRRRGRKIRRNPVAASRRRRHRRSHRRGNPISIRRSNPISGIGEFLSGMFGVGTGFALASLFDRMVTNHAYILSGGNGGQLMDAPAPGSIYNSEALLAPIWSKSNPSDAVPWRLVAAAGSVVVPLTVAAFLPRHPAAKAFFQLAGFGALGRFSGKLIEDGTAALFGSNQLVAKLYAPELAARSKMANPALPSAPAMTFAGALPQGLRRVGSAVQDSMGNEYVEVAAGRFALAPPPPPPAAEPVRELPANQSVAPQDVARAFEPAAPPVSRQFTEVPYNPLNSNPDGLARAFH